MADLKKSQVSVFVIIGVFILLGVVLYFIVSSDFLNSDNVDTEVRPVYNFIQDCILEAGENAIYQIGSTGGYVVAKEPYLKLDSEDAFSRKVSYYLEGDENLMPSLEVIEDEIDLYVDSMIYFCIADFRDFSEFEVSEGEVKTESVIEEDKVVLNVNYPVSLGKGDDSYSFEEFSVEVPIRLGRVYNVANEVLEKNSGKGICLSCLYDIGKENNVGVHMIEGSEGIVFVINDKFSKINGNNYEFYFAKSGGENEEG